MRYVFVGNSNDRNFTLADSLDNFNAIVNPGTKLDVDLRGYEGISITINKANDSPPIVLKSLSSAAANNAVSAKSFKDTVFERPNNVYVDRLPGHEKGKILVLTCYY